MRHIIKFKKEKQNTVFPENLWMNTGITMQMLQTSKIIKPHKTRFSGRTSHHVTMLKTVRGHSPCSTAVHGDNENRFTP